MLSERNPILITGAAGEIGGVSLMAAAARAQGVIEVFVNISEYEQSFMTFDKMTAAEEERRAWLGGLVANWSPQQRAHWVAEQVLEWSGVPTVNVRGHVRREPHPDLAGAGAAEQRR